MRPGDNDSAPALPRLPALEWLLARGHHGGRLEKPWREWLLERSGLDPGLLRQLPAGPATRLACDRPLADTDAQAWWLCAQPVHLLAGLDRLQLASPRLLVLQTAEADTLCESLVATLEHSGLRLELLDATRWLLRSEEPFEVENVEPAVALDEDLRMLRPQGPDARRLLALRGEIEMILHEHPVNVARERCGLPVVNSLWLHGSGRVATLAPVPLPSLASDDPWLRGLWRALGAHAEPPSQAIAADGGRASIHARSVEALAGASAEELRELDRALLEPVRAALASARLESLDLLVGDEAWQVNASDRWRFWRRTRPLRRASA
jgi:hypothetical protein